MSEEESSASSSKESLSAASSSKESLSVAREDEENQEEGDGYSYSPEYDDDMIFTCRRNSGGRNHIERIQTLQSSLKSAFDEYGMQFHDMEAELNRTKTENKELAKKNNKLEEKLKRAEEGEKSSKRNLEQTRNKLRELCTTFGAVKEECDQICNQEGYRGVAPQLSKKRKYVLKVYEVNDFLNCQICLEPWTHSGSHVICSLSCGHFFGRSCITKWISRDESRGSSTCPICLSRANLSDIRHHYVSHIFDGEVKDGEVKHEQ